MSFSTEKPTSEHKLKSADSLPWILHSAFFSNNAAGALSQVMQAHSARTVSNDTQRWRRPNQPRRSTGRHHHQTHASIKSHTLTVNCSGGLLLQQLKLLVEHIRKGHPQRQRGTLPQPKGRGGGKGRAGPPRSQGAEPQDRRPAPPPTPPPPPKGPQRGKSDPRGKPDAPLSPPRPSPGG